MKKHYDIEKLNPRKNPYAERLQHYITVTIEKDTADYFIEQSKNNHIPYQTLINMYLADCARKKTELDIVAN